MPLLEGSVARSGNRVRISAQLADAGNGQNLWGRDYEQDLQTFCSCRMSWQPRSPEKLREN